MADIWAHALYYSLAMNKESRPLKQRAIAAPSVLVRMEGRAELEKLYDLFRELFQGGDFAHLNALANTAKHRNVVRPSINEDLTGTRTHKHVFMLDSVTYDGVSYPSIAVTDLLQREFDRLMGLLLDIGNELNAVLERRVENRRAGTA